jgi:hypothetical protein
LDRHKAFGGIELWVDENSIDGLIVFMDDDITVALD